MKMLVRAFSFVVWITLLLFFSGPTYAQNNSGGSNPDTEVVRQNDNAPMSLSLVDRNGQAVDFKQFILAAEQLTWDKQLKIYFEDGLKRFLATCLAGLVGIYIVLWILPRWEFLEKIKIVGMVLSFILLLLGGFVFFKIETDKQFYEQTASILPRFAPPKTVALEPGYMVLSQGEGQRHFIDLTNDGVIIPEIARYTLLNISEINRNRTNIDVNQSSKLLNWNAIKRAKKHYEKTAEFLLEPRTPVVFGIDKKKESALSAKTFADLKKAFYKKNKSDRPERTSYSHYYYDDSDSLVGRIEEAGTKKLVTGIWEDAFGQKKTYQVPYMKISDGDPEVRFFHFKDTGSKDAWPLYVNDIPKPLKPNLERLGEWFKFQVGTSQAVNRINVPEKFCATHYFQYATGDRLYCTQQIWKNWLATLRTTQF